jgi:WD40 repeat protein
MAEEAEATSQADQAPDDQQATQAPDGAGATSGPDGHTTGEATAAARVTPSGNGTGAPEGAQYDLFLSYAEADREWVEGYLSNALTHAGVRFTSEATFALGVPRIQAFEQAVQQSSRTLLVLTSAYLADGLSQFVDLLAQTYGLESATWPVIPLILQPVTLPPRLAMLTRLDASDPARWDEAMERLSTEAQRPAPAPAPPPDCPYPGMVPFAEADSARFFGREEEVTDLLQRLRLHPFLAVIGPSGSGKSSLVFAGLLPALRRSKLFGSGGWRVCILRPGASPLAALGTALGSDPAEPAQAVVAALAAEAGAQRLLLVVDQLEELFTLGAQEATPFTQALLALADSPGCFVGLTVRADFYPDLMTSLLWERVQAHRAEVVPLSSEGLRQAIVRPAEDVGVFVETALVERLLADAASEPGVLPLVQETLVLLWEHLERRYLPLRAYERMAQGEKTGLQVAIARRADAALAALSPARQAIARRIFLRLVQFGEGRADTRRQQPLDELRAAGDEAAAFDQTLAHLVASRLLTLSGGDGGSERMVDIAHEALIGGWPALQEWIQARRAAELTRRRLEEKAQDWVRLGRGRGGLLDEVELAEAESWLGTADARELGYDAALAGLAQASRVAIEAAAQAQEAARQRELAQARALAAEQQRVAEEQLKRAEAESQRAEEQARSSSRLRRLVAGLVVLVILAIGASVIAAVQQQQARTAEASAKQAEATAKQQAAVATSRQLAAQANDLLNHDELNLALLMAVKANKVDNTAEARASLRQGLAYSPLALSFLYGNKNGVCCVAFSPNGQILASGSADGIIWLWNIQARRQDPARLARGLGAVDSVVFSPNGKILASGDAHKTVRLWNIATHQQLGAPLTGHTGPVNSVAFSPNGKIVASGSADGTIRLWDVAAHRQIGRPLITHHSGPVNSVAFSPDGKTLASGGCGKRDRYGNCIQGEIRLWDVATDRQIGTPFTGHTNSINSVAFSPDGKTLASGSLDMTICLWDVATHRQSGAPLAGHTDYVLSVAFSPDGKTLASGSKDRTIRLWDVATHQQLGAPLFGHTSDVLDVTFSRDGRTLASSGKDTTIILWNVANSWAPLMAHKSDVFSVAFSPDGKTLASGGCGKLDARRNCIQGEIRLWDVATDRQIGAPFTGHTNSVNSVAFSPDGKMLASGSLDMTVRLWDVATHRQIGAPLAGHTDYVLSVAFSPDGKTLASGSKDRTIRLWDVATHRQIGAPFTGHTNSVNSVAFSPDGKMLASGSLDMTIRLWDVATHQQLGAPLAGHTDQVFSVAFSPDGKMLASGSQDQSIRLWNVAYRPKLGAPQPGAPLIGHSDGVSSVAFSPDGKTLASGSLDMTIRLWDVATHQQLGAPLTGHASNVHSVAFSPDGEILASGSQDSTIRLWGVDELQGSISALEGRACSIANRNLNPKMWPQYFPDLPYQQICPGVTTT